MVEDRAKGIHVGANVHATNDLGETPLHCAVKGAADAETVEALLRVGASPFALNDVHLTPVDLAKVRVGRGPNLHHTNQKPFLISVKCRK